MAKKSSVEKNNRRKSMIEAYAERRENLKKIIKNRDLPEEERFAAVIRLSEMPRNSSATRHRNRCFVTGRARGFYRDYGICRMMIRQMAADGYLPGVFKASW